VRNAKPSERLDNALLFTVDSAKQFLLSKLSAQADKERTPLDEIEKKMFLFSEVSGNADFETQEIFDQKYDSKVYESKVTKLLRKAYAGDKRTEEGKNEWNDALRALKREDFYGLVMVDKAKIPRSHTGLWEFELQLLPFEIVELVVIVLGFLIVFRPSALGLYLPDWVRWLAYPLFIWLFLYIGKVFSRRQTAKALKRLKPPES
jgi:hypothetical protein